jgi:hypothetical protein
MTLDRAFNNYVRSTHLKDGTETGIITFADGDSACFWFLSHHLADDVEDIGGTFFKSSDGSTAFMSGYFCCELQLPDKQLASLVELRSFIKTYDGVHP